MKNDLEVGGNRWQELPSVEVCCSGTIVLMWWWWVGQFSLFHTPLGSVGQGNHPPLKKVGAAAGPIGPNGGKEVEQSGKSDFYNSPLDNKRGVSEGTELGSGGWC